MHYFTMVFKGNNMSTQFLFSIKIFNEILLNRINGRMSPLIVNDL